MKHFLAALLALAAIPAAADSSHIKAVHASHGSGGWRFDVTLAHPDSGWDHYADGWRVLAMDGTELGMRTLAHPHVNEQPFTRSLGGVKVPDSALQVQIQARCIVDGWASETYTVTLE